MRVSPVVLAVLITALSAGVAEVGVRYFALKVRSLAILMRYLALFSVIFKIGISPDRYHEEDFANCCKKQTCSICRLLI